MKTDMTQGTEWKKILSFSLPIIIGQLIQQLYTTVDGIVVGRFVDQNALAAVGSCMALVMIFMGLAIGLTTGNGIMIAQYYGAKKQDELSRCVSTSMILIGALGIAVTLFTVFGARFLVTSVLKVDIPEIREQAITYFMVSSIGMGFHFLFTCVNSILRSIGDSRATLYFLVFSALLNLVLDLLFVVALDWGVAGAGLCSIIVYLSCMIVSMIYMFKKYPVLRFRLKDMKFDVSKAKVIFRLGLPAVLQQEVTSLGHLLIQHVVISFGADTMAAFTVGTRIDGMLFAIVFGMNAGISTFTGQNIGAGEIERVKNAWKRGLLMSGLITLFASSTVFVFAAPLAQLFDVSGEAMTRSVEFLKYNCTFFTIFALNGVTLAVLQGAGDVLFTTVASLTSFTIRVTVTFLLAYVFKIGYTSIWLTVPFGWTASLIMGLIRYSRGAWKKKDLVNSTGKEKALEAAE